MSLSLFGGTGFILSRYAQLYPEAFVEPRDRTFATHPDALYGISTTDNYAPTRGDLHVDIDTNVTHLMRILPNVQGTFTFLSSWFVVANAGDDPAYPAHEESRCDPHGFYSASKLCAEHLIRSYCETFNRPYRILRLCNVLGNDPRASKQKAALIDMLGKVKRGEDVDVYEGDGFRNWLHVNDVCRAINLCLSTDATLNSVTHIGAPRSERTYDLIQHAIARTGSRSRVNIVPVPRFHKVVQVESFHFDTTKLRGLGFVPDMGAYEAVDRVLAGITV